MAFRCGNYHVPDIGLSQVTNSDATRVAIVDKKNTNAVLFIVNRKTLKVDSRRQAIDSMAEEIGLPLVKNEYFSSDGFEIP